MKNIFVQMKITLCIIKKAVCGTGQSESNSNESSKYVFYLPIRTFKSSLRGNFHEEFRPAAALELFDLIIF